MLTKLILSLLTINILMKTTSTQYYANPYYENMPQQYYPQQPDPQDMDYDEPIEHEHTRRSRRKEYGSSGGRLPHVDYEYDESDECKCSCGRCKDKRRPPKPCCREMCFSCSDMQEQPGQGGLVLVPYPYPLMLPNMIRNETTTTTTTTTTSENPTTSTGRTSEIVKINTLLRSPHTFKGDGKYMLTTIRKTKPTWEPKYGIVPIPDTLAEKLMSQLRQVRELQARRF